MYESTLRIWKPTPGDKQWEEWWIGSSWRINLALPEIFNFAPDKFCFFPRPNRLIGTATDSPRPLQKEKSIRSASTQMAQLICLKQSAKTAMAKINNHSFHFDLFWDEDVNSVPLYTSIVNKTIFLLSTWTWLIWFATKTQISVAVGVLRLWIW